MIQRVSRFNSVRDAEHPSRMCGSTRIMRAPCALFGTGSCDNSLGLSYVRMHPRSAVPRGPRFSAAGHCTATVQPRATATTPRCSGLERLVTGVSRRRAVVCTALACDVSLLGRAVSGAKRRASVWSWDRSKRSSETSPYINARVRMTSITLTSSEPACDESHIVTFVASGGDVTVRARDRRHRRSADHNGLCQL